MPANNKLGAARQALDQFLTAVNTPMGQSVASSLVGGTAGYAGSQIFNSISPVDIDPEMAAGIGGSLGAMMGSKLLQKARARADANKYGTQLGLF